MGTRGLIGFYKDGKTKATYNHFDSYPSGVGVEILKELRKANLKKLNKTFENIVLINGNSKPTKEQIKETKEFINLTVSEQSTADWYCLLREAQGTLKPYIDGKLKYMIDNQDFIKDSLFCEWAYLVNLNDNRLEVYKGFNQDKDIQAVRYRIEKSDNKYYACSLVASYPLDKLPSDKQLEKLEARNE